MVTREHCGSFALNGIYGRNNDFVLDVITKLEAAGETVATISMPEALCRSYLDRADRWPKAYPKIAVDVSQPADVILFANKEGVLVAETSGWTP